MLQVMQDDEAACCDTADSVSNTPLGKTLFKADTSICRLAMLCSGGPENPATTGTT